MQTEQSTGAAPTLIRATDILRAKHAGLAWLFARYRDGEDGTRESIGRRVCAHLRLYSVLEEDVLYPAIRHEAEEGLVRRSIKAHAAFRTCIAELSELSPYEPEHEEMMVRLIEAAEEHIAEEEAQLFPLLEERLPNTLRRIATDMLEPAARAE